MKVLLVSPLPPPPGGIATVTSNLLDYFRTNPGNLELLLYNTTLKFRSITSQSTILRIFSGLYNSIIILFFVRKAIKKKPPEIIHLASSASFALFKDLLIVLLAKHYNIPIILHWHFGRIPELSVKNNWEWKLLKHLVKKCSRSIVIDTGSYLTLRKAGLYNTLNIPNPLGLEVEKKIKVNSGKTNQRLSNRIIFVGHLVRSKGVYELVEACSDLSSVKDLSLIGPYEENVRNDLLELAGKRENGNWLHLIGELDNDEVLEQMHLSPILVLPSYTEGFPYAVIEGMAMGCAVIATDVGAIPEILDIDSDKPCGICVPPRNCGLLSAAINNLILDQVKIKMMGENGIRKVLNNYTINNIAAEYKKLWETESNQYVLIESNDEEANDEEEIVQIPHNNVQRYQSTEIIKLLLVSPLPPPIGGIASWTPIIIEYFEHFGGEIRVTLLNSALKGKTITSNSLLKRFFSGIYNSLWINMEFRKLIGNCEPCLIHLVSSASLALFKDYLLIKVAKKNNIPIIMHWRFGRIPALAAKRNWEWKLLKIIIKRSTLSIVIDSRSHDALLRAGLTSVTNIPNPLGPDIEQKSRTLIERSSQRKHGRLIFVGHIVKSKGVFELVKACSELSAVKELIVIGPCEENVKKGLRKIAGKRENGLWLNVLGQLDKNQVLEQLSISPVLVLPSYTEGFPNAVLEGMAMGCAVIATDVGAIPEMLDVQTINPCGICVPPQNVEKLKEAVFRLVQDPLTAELMGKNGIHKVLNNYTIEIIAKLYWNVWKNALHG